MGAQIAAHLANAGVRTHLLDIVPKDAGKDPKARNALALGALKQMAKAKPAPFMRKDYAARITPGNLDDDLDAAVADSDLVIEAVVERLDIKKPLFARIAAKAPEHAVLATNTSGLPIGDVAADLPEGGPQARRGHALLQPAALHAPARGRAPASTPTPRSCRTSRGSRTRSSARASCRAVTPRTSSATGSASPRCC